MSQNICNICGANYEYRNGRWICPACGAYKSEEFSNEEVTLLYNANQKLRLSDFDEAEKSFSDIIEKYPQNPNGYWGRLLAKYGIKYEDDFDGRKIPTCYATSIESVMSDKDYHKAIELADADTKAYYQKQAEYIERVRKEWVEKARKEKPYDIFLCYKDSDLANGIDRTKDSVAVQELYIHLTKQGYRVFFSRESLRDKVGEKYEPYIFNALSTAKVMLVYGSSSEYITSTWLKNEWTRYEKRLRAGEKKPNSLLVACDGFSPNELPKTLSYMQCFDATKPSFYSDLDVVVNKLIKGEEKPKPEASAQPQNKSKKAPVAIAAVAVVIAVVLFILIPNLLNKDGVTSLKNLQYNASISISDGEFPNDASFKVDKFTASEELASTLEKLPINQTNYHVYDMGLYSGNSEVDVNGKVVVTMPLPDDILPNKAVVYYVSGSTSEKISSSVMGGEISFTTTHFSIYVIAEKAEAQTPPDDDQSNNGNAGDNNDQNPDNNPPEKVTIHFNANGGTGSMSSITVERNEYFDMPTNGFTREGYTFVGWSTTAAGIEWEYPEGAKCKATTSTTYYARWTADNGEETPNSPQTVNITFNANGGSGTMPYQTVTVGVQSILNECTFTREGYMFAGWATSAEGTTEYTDGASITVNTENAVSLYAIWVPNSNSLIFNANGGSGYMESISIETNQTITLPGNAFAKSGYTFAGWSDVQGGDIKYIDSGSFKMTSSASITLYAVWTANTNSVVLKANNDTNNETTVNIKTDETKNLPTNIFTKVGYTFVGWSSSSNGSVEYTDGASYTMGDSSVTMYAVWEANTNSINFNANGGTGSMSAQQAKTDEKVNLKQNSFTREGYTFAGWATSSTGNAIYADQAAYTVGTNAEYMLYAVWIKAAYTITYHMNGGSNNINNPVGYDVTDATITFADPTRDGYTFLGWYTDYLLQNKIISIPKGSTGNKTLYASWAANTNSINFNANGGSGTMTTQQAKTNETVVLQQNAFTRDGYRFIGWSTTSDGTVGYFDKASYTMGAAASITLYASWEPITYSISYDMQGGTISGNKTSYSVTTSTFTLPTPTKTGYSFLGWSGTDISGMQMTVTVSQGSIGNRSYTANWEKIICTITYNMNDGINDDSNPTTYTIDTSDIILIDPIRTGYTFKGWYSNSAFTNKVTIIDTSELTNVTLYAKWEKTNYIITYYMDGGTNNALNPSSYTIDSNSITLAEPTKSSYSFKGWYTDSSFNNKVVSVDTSSLSNVTLYAKWEFDFTYKASNGEITITGYTGGATAIIPSKIDGIDVTSIGENAFRERTRLVTVIVPDCIETIGMYAFYGCSSLESVEFGVSSKLNTIESYAFLSCTSLTTFNIPKSVKVIESDPFAGTALTEITIPSSVTNIYSFECTTLENINVEDNNTTYKSVNGVLYSENGKTLIQYPSGRKDASFTIPSTVTDISNAFENASYLKNIIIPESVQNIGSYAFARCESLESIEIPYGENILDNTFRWCSSLTSITIPQSVTDIWKYTFSYCNSLTTINYKGTVEQWNAIYKSTDYDSDSGDYIVYCMDGYVAKDGTVTVTGDVWDGTTSYSFAGGTGTEADPYLISTAEQLAYVATAVNQGVDTFNGKHLKLTLDICLMNLEWTPIGNSSYRFEGVFDGDGHTIHNLKVSNTTIKSGGLFGETKNAILKNVNIADADIKLAAAGRAGILVGYAIHSDTSTVVIDNCHVSGKVYLSEGAYAGGVAGNVSGSVANSSASANVSSSSVSSPGITSTCRIYVGGIAGYCINITNCYTTGSISASGGNLYHHNSWAGGIVGTGGTITNCYSTATVTATTYQSSYCGGIAGEAGTISNSFSTGNLKAKAYSSSNAYVGRIIGELEDSDVIESCYADSTQTCTQSSERYDNTKTTNSEGSLQFTQTLQSENFIYNTLGWSSDVWQITEGGFPTLK